MPLVTAATYLVVNGVTLATPAWRVTDWLPLLNDPPVVGDNRTISGADGRRAYPRTQDELRVTLPMVVIGSYDQDGNRIANERQGLIDNREYLRANLGVASSVGDGTVAATWHHFDGGTQTADVQVLGLFGFVRVSPAVARTTLDLIIPAGAFT